MSNILVVGGAGFIGSALAERLIEDGHHVAVVDDLSAGKEEYIHPASEFHRADICTADLDSIFDKGAFDFVFHLAAQIDVRVSVAEPERDNRINVLGALRVLQSCHAHGVKKIIFTSSGGAVYGDAVAIPTAEDQPTDPVSPYGIHKLTFEKYLYYYRAVHGEEYATLRLSNVYGPKQYRGGESGVIAIFTDHLIRGQPVVVYGDGKQTRDYVYVDDVVDALVRAMTAAYSGTINISSGTETDVLGLVGMFEEILGEKATLTFAPERKGEQRRSCLANTRAEQVLQWRPRVALRGGIEKTLHSARA